MELINDFINLIFPRYSILDGQPLVKNEQFFTTEQAALLPRFNLLRDESQLLLRLYGLVPVSHVLAYLKFVKNGSVQKILHHIKYNEGRDLGFLMGQWFGQALVEYGFVQSFDLIIPLPLHPSRLQSRGFNQSRLIVEGMSDVLAIPWKDGVISRRVKNISQTYQDRLSRYENVANIFSLDDPEAIKGKRILLVDDVITTGATLESCVRELIKGEDVSISVAALAAAEK